MNGEGVTAVLASARGLDALLLAVLIFTAAIGITIVLREAGGTAIRGLALERLRQASPPWLADAVLAAGAVAYVALGAIPMARHLPFLDDTFPLSAVLACFEIAAGFVAILLAFLV